MELADTANMQTVQTNVPAAASARFDHRRGIRPSSHHRAVVAHEEDGACSCTCFQGAAELTSHPE
jgi:hypothetical protein